MEDLLRQLTHCRDEAHELKLPLVEYVLGLARHELGTTLRRARSRQNG